MKKIVWIWKGRALEDLQRFSPASRREAGYQLSNIQEGLDPSDWKPMKSIGSGVKELRIHCENEYRVIYIAKFEEAIYVLHVFEKKTRKTAQKEINIAKTRYADLLKNRVGG